MQANKQKMDENHNTECYEKQQEAQIQPDRCPDSNGKLLVFVNPNSGLGKSINTCNDKIAPFLRSNNIRHEIFITVSNKATREYLANLPLSELFKLRAIVVVSGDGLVHEVVNGLMSRADWTEALKIPIGVIPTGSGNGLAYTLIRERHPDLTSRLAGIELCCKHAIQLKTIEIDLVKINYGWGRKKVWSFLSFGWGLLANIDIDSEWLRRFGDFRFTVYGLLRSITSTSSRAKLSYKLAPDVRVTDQETQTIPGLDCDQIKIEDKFACVYAVYLSHISRKTHFSPKSTLNDQLIYLTYIRGRLSTRKVIKFLLAIDTGTHDRLPYVNVVPVTEFEFQPIEESKIVVDGEAISWTPDDGPVTAKVVPGVMKLLWDRDM